jgi:hypothetical protein
VTRIKKIWWVLHQKQLLWAVHIRSTTLWETFLFFSFSKQVLWFILATFPLIKLLSSRYTKDLIHLQILTNVVCRVQWQSQKHLQNEQETAVGWKTTSNAISW